MTKEVVITTRGMQFAFDEQIDEKDYIEIGSSALYYDKGRFKYVLYDELMEGVSEPVSNTIKFSGNVIEINKKGPISVHMVFECGKHYMTTYHTPFGNILIGITTHRIEIIEEENHIHLEADYGIDLNEEFLSDCKMLIDIFPQTV